MRVFGFDLASPKNSHVLGYLLLLPAGLLISAIIIYPLMLSLDISFQEVKIPRPGGDRKPWTTVNYAELAGSSEFWNACWVTLKLVVVVSASCFLIGLGTALLVNQHFKGRTLARLLVALPWAIPEVVATVVFWWLFDTSYGAVNWLIVVLGFTEQPMSWFSNPTAAFALVSIVMTWKGYPFVSIMILAGLQAIPEDYYNAAKVDRANAWQRFVHITMPCLVPVLAVTMVLCILWIFRDFSIIYVLTGGGPINATETLSILTYERAFGFFEFGSAAAVGIVTLVICLVFSRIMVARRVEAMH